MPLLLDRRIALAPDPARVSWLGEWSYAHRGLHTPGVPENSLSAFAAALERGMGIEFDIQRSADGRAMVFHDWELERLTDAVGPVAALDAAALEQTALKGSEDRIPSLRDVLALVAGRVPILIEIKSRRGYDVAVSCAAVRDDLEGYAGLHAVMSFDPRAGQWFARNSPQTVRGLVVTEENHRGRFGDLRRRVSTWIARADFLAYDIRDLPSAFAAAQRARGLPVLTWTVRSPELRARAALHADAPIAEGAGVA